MSAEARMIIRRATPGDAQNLFAWRNDPLTQQMSRRGDAVAWDDHLRWLEGVLADPDRVLLVGEVEGRSVGTVRFDRLPEPDHWEISWTVNPEFRGRGYGSALSVGACATLPTATIFAEIKADNHPTLTMIAKCGFKQIDEREGVTYWRRDPLDDIDEAGMTSAFHDKIMDEIEAAKRR